MAPDSAQKIANAAKAVQAAPVKSRCAKTSPARTNRFLTHCRGRIEITIALSIAIAASDPTLGARPRSDGGAGPGREGSKGPVPAERRRDAARPDGAQPPRSSARVPRGLLDPSRPGPAPPSPGVAAWREWRRYGAWRWLDASTMWRSPSAFHPRGG